MNSTASPRWRHAFSHKGSQVSTSADQVDVWSRPSDVHGGLRSRFIAFHLFAQAPRGVSEDRPPETWLKHIAECNIKVDTEALEQSAPTECVQP
jgi:hypothetical protein